MEAHRSPTARGTSSAAVPHGSATVIGVGHLLGYARVSTADPAAGPAGRRARARRLLPGVTETAGGAATARPALEQVLTSCAPAAP